MKKILKSRIFIFILGLVIAGSIGVYATIEASNITYNGTTVDLVLDDLYNKANKDNYNDKTYTQEGLVIFNDRVTILSGGYYVDENNITWVNLRLKTNQSLTSNTSWLLLNGLPNMNNRVAISDTTNNFNFTSGNYDSKNGRLDLVMDYYANTIQSNTEFTIQFKY